MNKRAFSHPRHAASRVPRRVLRALSALAVLAGVLAVTAGSASAWYATPSGHFECVVAEDGFYVGLTWSVSSWQPGDITGVNPAIVVEMSRDGGPSEVIGSGAFTAENSVFGGSMIVPEGPGSLTLTAYPTAPWGDGTVDSAPTSVELYVPTLEEIGDPRCLVKPEKPTEVPTEKPTEVPAAPPEKPAEVPSPPPEKPVEEAKPPAPEKPAAEVTPAPKKPEVSPEVTVLPPTAVQPEMKVEAKVLARTGSETMTLTLLAVALIVVGAASSTVSRRLSRVTG